MPTKQRPIDFPFHGLVETLAVARQPQGTSPSCLNVVAFDPATGRNRGASRGGIRRFCPDQLFMTPLAVVPVPAPIQDLNHVSSPADPGSLLLEKLTSEDDIGVDGGFILLEDLTLADIQVTDPDADGTIDIGGFQAGNQGARQTVILAVADGYVYKVNETEATLVDGQTTRPLSQNAYTIFSVQFEDRLFFVDGEHYVYYDIGLDSMFDWEPVILTASSASPVVITTQKEHGYVTGDTVIIDSVRGNDAANGTWTITRLTDTTFSLNSSVGTGSGTGGSASSNGPLPRDAGGNACTLICLWHGRIVLSGLKLDPTNYFALAVDDPFNANYSPDTETVTQAVAGNTADAGKAADIITALIPYSDDVLLLGGSHTLERMSGDPADGGRRDHITEITGIAFGQAWTKTPDGTTYFMGSRGGVYQMPSGGGIPQNITLNTINERMADLDMDANAFRMAWDDRGKGVEVLVTAKDGSASTHYFYDVRNQAWWPFSFSNADQNPLTCHLLEGVTVSGRSILLGSFDGWIRMFDHDALTDDGETINSSVLIGPLNNTLIVEWMATLGQTSGQVNWELLDGNSAEEALASNPVAFGTFRGGRNRSQYPRRYLNSGWLRLTADNPWALEELISLVEPQSETRNRIF